MTEQELMIVAVLADPHSDLPRLTYADWLDDHAGTVMCNKCEGKGENSGFSARGGIRRMWTCRSCDGSGSVSDGKAERAEYIRVSIRSLETSSDDLTEWNETRTRTRMSDLLTKGRFLEWFGLSCFTGFKVTVRNGGHVELYHEGQDCTAHFEIRGGFVDEVRLPLAALLGGPCDGCDGVGFLYDERTEDGQSTCPDCSGTGRTPGVARDLFRAHPVTRVALADRRPYGSGCWYDDAQVTDTERDGSCLPTDVWRLLAGAEIGRWYGRQKRYEGHDPALAALSEAVTDRCRGLVGLKPLYAKHV